MKFLIFVLSFFVFSALVIISNNDLALISDDNISRFFGLYFSWLSEVYDNLGVLTGKVIEMNWTPR